jgi:iron complex outermembrane recepter protein
MAGRMRRWCAWACVAWLVGGAAAWAQGVAPHRLEGVVLDSSGGRVSGAVVLLGDRESSVATTDAEGAFRFERVEPGDYRLRVESPGFAGWTDMVRVSGERRVTVELSLAPFAETVGVSARAPIRAPDASTGTRIAIPLRDQPQAVQVVTRELLEARQAIRLGESADHVSSVHRASGYGGVSSNNYFVRGFRTRGTYRNGYREEGFLDARDVANVDRIEFLKGPASVLYGAAEVGGVVNTITKRALEQPHARLSVVTGSEGLVRPTADFGGPIAGNGSLLYRLNASVERSEGFRDHHHTRSYFVAPRLAWRPGPRTIVEFDGEFQRYEYTFDVGFLAQPEFLSVPIGSFFGEPFNRGRNRQRALRGELTQQLSEGWTLRAGLSTLRSNADPIYASMTGLQANRRTINRIVWESDEASRDYTVRGDLLGTARTGRLHHRAVIGAEWTRRLFAYDFQGFGLAPIDLYQPVHGAQAGSPTFGFSDDQRTDATAVYVQDLIEVTRRVKVLAGVRAQAASSRYRDYVTHEVRGEQDDRAVTPRAGIVYAPGSATSLYASYARSFFPQAPTVFSPASRDGGGFRPERGRQIEVGVKQGWFDERLSATLAAYRIRKTDVVTPDPDVPQVSIQTGEQISRGVELDVVGEPAPGWVVVGTWAWTDAFISRDNRFTVGTGLVGVPRHAGSLYAAYRLPVGLGVGAGVVGATRRSSSLNPNTAVLPSYARLDLHGSLSRARWDLRVALKNVLDGRHYDNHATFVVPQPPRTLLVSLGTSLTR